MPARIKSHHFFLILTLVLGLMIFFVENTRKVISSEEAKPESKILNKNISSARGEQKDNSNPLFQNSSNISPEYSQKKMVKTKQDAEEIDTNVPENDQENKMLEESPQNIFFDATTERHLADFQKDLTDVLELPPNRRSKFSPFLRSLQGTYRGILVSHNKINSDQYQVFLSFRYNSEGSLGDGSYRFVIINDRNEIGSYTGKTLSKFLTKKSMILRYSANGIRAVYSEGRVIQWRPDKGNIITDLDAFQGNSGSAVLAKEDGALIGHLISGTDDYIQTNLGCKLPRNCPEAFRSGDSCQGEVVMNAERYKHLIHSNSTYRVSEQSLEGFEKITIPSSYPASEVNVKFLLNRPSVYMVSVAGSIGHFQVWKKEGDEYLSKGISKGSRLFNLGLGEYILGLKKGPVNALEASVQEALQDNMAFEQQTLDQPLRLNLSPYSARYTRFSISQEGTYRISVFPDQSNSLDPFLQIFAREDNGSLRFLDEGDDDLTSAYPTVEIYLTHGDYALEISELSQEQGQVFVQIDPLDKKT